MTFSLFQPGDKVQLCTEITGVIDEVVFTRGSPEPVYLVQWWHGGQVHERRFVADDLKGIEI